MKRHFPRTALACTALGLAACSTGDPSSVPPRTGEARSALSTCIQIQRGASGTLADTQIADNRLGKNFGRDPNALTGTLKKGLHQTLLQADLSAIPSNAVVTSATLTLWQTNDAQSELRAHRVLAPWDERKVSWKRFGGAYASEIAASTNNGGPSSTAAPVTFELSELAQGWVNGAVDNHGILIEQESTAGTTSFHTSEHADPASRPRFDICYTAGPVADGSLLIHVLDSSGNPIPSAAVTFEGELRPTNGAGYLRLDNLPAGRVVAKVESHGFASGTVSVDLPASAHGGTEIRLLPLGTPLPFDAAVGAALDQGHVHLTIPSGALVDHNGEPLTGNVEATIVPLDPTTGMVNMPGPLEGVTVANGNSVALESISMAEVTIWNNGVPAQLAPGQKATLELVLPDALASKYQIGDTIPAWWFDLDAGIWREEGAGVVQSSMAEPGKLAWVTEVGHFTWWNCDQPLSNTNCFDVTVVDSNGIVVPNLSVGATGVDYTGVSQPSYTQANGHACVNMKLGGTANIVVGPSAAPIASMLVTASGPASNCAGQGAACAPVTLVVPNGSICTPGDSSPCAYTGPAGTEGVGICQAGTNYCNITGTGWTSCTGEVHPQAETCGSPNLDEDCDGLVNEEGSGCTCIPGTKAVCYTGPAGTVGVGTCDFGERTCNFNGNSYGPCNGEVVPKPENCSTPEDENCDGSTSCACEDGLVGKVACWPLDETSGTISVDLINGNNGTQLNGPMSTIGPHDGALAFDGLDDYVSVPNSPSLSFGTGDFSISFYVRTTATGLPVLLDKRTEASGPVRGFVVYGSGGNLGFQMADGTHTNYGTSAYISDGQWHHVVITVERALSTGLKVYLDKALTNTMNPTGRQGSLDTPRPLTIGRRSDSSSAGYFSGALDEIKLFNRALSATEIQAL